MVPLPETRHQSYGKGAEKSNKASTQAQVATIQCTSAGTQSVPSGSHANMSMADPNEDKIDFSKLEKELSAAVESDAHYWRENDAKLRAVEQRVETYEQFRDMVAAAHIKPLEKHDKNGILTGSGSNGRNQPWNPYSSKGDKRLATSTGNHQQTMHAASLPANSNEFTKRWRKLKEPTEKYTFLISIGGDHLSKIFHAEISYGLLGDIITALSACLEPSDLHLVVHILTCLTQANRFDLSLDFLSKAEKIKCSELILQLEKHISDAIEGSIDGIDSSTSIEDAVDDTAIEARIERKSNDKSSHSEINEEENKSEEPCKKSLMITKDTIEKLKKLYKVLPLGR